MSQIRVYGTAWCGDCIRAKRYMDDNGIEYSWTDIDKETQFIKFIKELNGGKQRVPTIIFSDDSVLVEPTNEQLRTKLGL